MGRKKINEENKKKTFSLHIPLELLEKLEGLKLTNRSKFFTWLLEEYFNKNYEEFLDLL